MLNIDCETWCLSFVLVWWPYLGKMIFWNVSIVTVLILPMIKLLRVLWCPKHTRLSHRKFLSGGNTWKTMAIRVFKNKPKSCMVAIATLHECWLVERNFSERNIHRKKIHKAVTPNSKPFWRYPSVDRVNGKTVLAGLNSSAFICSVRVIEDSLSRTFLRPNDQLVHGWCAVC